MELAQSHTREQLLRTGSSAELTEDDLRRFRQVTSTQISPEQAARIVQPPRVYDQESVVMALHWHPEFVPMPMIRERIAATFPNKQLSMIIPTQHNVTTSFDAYAGVEIDCYSKEFNRKVQLLVHGRADAFARAGVLQNMLAHTFKYRTSQLHEYIDSILDDRRADRISLAVAMTGADDELVGFVRHYVDKIRRLIIAHESSTAPEMLRNKLLRDFFDTLRDRYDDHLIAHAQVFLKTIKEIVKERFDLTYFYETWEIIEEARSIGAGIVVPHPEQFWPILLADYYVDGYEVWNPQSQEFTEFLIQVVNKKNRSTGFSDRRLLVFMGDDCHMGEKTKAVALQDTEKAKREIGVQPAWDDIGIRKALSAANFDKKTVIEEYTARLGQG